MNPRILFVSALVLSGLVLCGSAQNSPSSASNSQAPAIKADRTETPVRVSLSGRVSDPSGAVVSGATVKVTNRSNGEVISITSGESGEFSAQDLSAGNYDIIVSYPGFTPFSKTNVTMIPYQAQVMDFVLQLSGVNEQTTVTAKAPAGEGALETSPTNSHEVLEIREVRESSAKDMGEAISNLDGVWKVRKAGIANDVVIRGFQQGNIDVLIDGMRVYEACPSQMDPAAYHVDFAEVDKVDVTKGPFDTRNQGSLGGTVNVVSRMPGSGVLLTPNFATGSFGFYNPSVVASGSKRLMHSLGGYSYRRGDPFVSGSGHDFTYYANFTPAGANNAAFDSRTVWTRNTIDLAHNQHLTLSYGNQADGLTLYPTLKMDALYNNSHRIDGNWNLSQLTGVVKAVTAQAYFSQVVQWMTDHFRTTGGSGTLGYGMGTMAGTRTLGGRIEAEMPNMIAGVELYDRGWSAYNYQFQMATKSYLGQKSLADVRMIVAGIYSQYSHTFGKAFITAGGRLDTGASAALNKSVNTDLYWAYNSTRSTSASDVNPSANVKVAYLLPRGIELFAGVGSNVRLPDPEERYYGLKSMGRDWVGNPLLQPTRNSEGDLGFTYRSRYVSIRPTAFYSALSNFVAVTKERKVNPTPGIMNSTALSYQGVDAKLYGGEFSYSVEFTRSLLFSGGVSYTRGTHAAKTSEGMPGGDLAEIPPLKSRASLRYGTGLFFGEINGLAGGRQDKVDVLLNEQPTPGYGIFGVKGGLHTKNWNLSAGGENLANRFYYEHLSFVRDPDRLGIRIPEPGRAFYLNLSVNLFGLVHRD